MQTAVRNRRLLACLGASLVVHALAVIGWRHREVQAPLAGEAPPVSFDPVEPVHAPHAAIVGERPSGRGHALAGSNPRVRGSPWRAARKLAAVGRGDGAGTEGSVTLTPSTAAAPPTESTAISSTPAVISDVAIPPPSANAAQPIDPVSAPASPSVDADREFDRRARAQLVSLAKGNGGGLAGFGPGNGGTGFGLTTDLSGHHRPDSPVVTPPVILERRPVECELPGTLNLRAIVRVLVTRDGNAAVPRIYQPSGYAGFDRCALSYVLALRFAPGTDAGGKPLNVWMNVRVAPSTMGQLEDLR